MRESEQRAVWGILGAALMDEGLMLTALGKLRPDAMVGKERLVLDGLRAVAYRGATPSLVVVVGELERLGTLQQVGGGAALSRLLEYATVATNFDAMLGIVNDEAIARAVKHAAEDALLQLGAGMNGPEALDDCEARLLAIRREASAVEPRSIGEILLEMREGTTAGVKTGFRTLDWATGGLRPGTLSVIGARPGVGKTALITAIADHVLAEGGAVAFFSLEMPERQIMERWAARRGAVLAEILRGGSAIDEARGRLEKLPLTIIPPGEPSLLSLRARLRRMSPKPALVVVDYLQLLEPCRQMRNRYELVDQATLELRQQVAREFQVPVLAAAQLNRAMEREHRLRPPRLSDLRESGGIENHADLIALLHRPKGGTPQLAIEKNRYGPDQVGCDLHFERERATYFDVEDR